MVRYIRHGIRGVRLEGVRLGGRWITTLEAIDRFSADLTNRCPLPGEPGAGTQEASEAGSSRSCPPYQQRQARAAQELVTLGV